MSPIEESGWEAVVLGAGPSGCAAATALARAGRRVLLVDRDPKPRFKIGESLLPRNLPIFERLGLMPKIRAAGFQEKFGAFFWNESTGGVRKVWFRDSWSPEHCMAYQVQRQVFDGLLADHARDCGVTVERGVSVEGILEEGSRVVGVRLSGPQGSREERAPVVVDATGQAAFIASRKKLRQGDPNLKRAALFAHYRGAWRDVGERAGDILLPFLPDVWYWVIPFADGTASVGAVFLPSLLKELAGTKEEQLDDLLGRSAKMKEILSAAERLTPVQGLSDYSVMASTFAGDGWVLAGDSAAFLDPVFSTGVFLGMSAGIRAADVIDASLKRKGRVDAADFAGYEATTRAMIARFKPFVYGYYDPVFAREFCDRGPAFMERAVTSTLSGDVENPSFAVRAINRWVVAIFATIGRLERLRGRAPAYRGREVTT